MGIGGWAPGREDVTRRRQPHLTVAEVRATQSQCPLHRLVLLEGHQRQLVDPAVFRLLTPLVEDACWLPYGGVLEEFE